MNLWLILPVAIPLAAAAAGLLAWQRRRAQRVIGVVGMAAQMVAGIGLLVNVWRHGVQAAQIGAWPAPFGITLAADLFSAVMVAIAGLMGLVVALYSLLSMDAARERFGYYPLLAVLLMGVSGAFLTGDIFSLYVWFEVMLIASFVLVALGGERAQLEGAIKYVTLNLMASAVFLSAAGLLYHAAGTLNMADLALRIPTINPGLAATLAVMFMVSFGIKAGVFPLFFWLPDSYHTPPLAVTTIFSALLTKVGVYALVRVFTLIFVQDVAYTHHLLLMVIAGATMVTGVLGAVAQYEVRRLLSFHIISQIGYLLMGLAIFTPLALAGTVYFMVHVILAKSTLFLVAGVLHRLRGSYQLRVLGGAYRDHPLLAVLFLIGALALAGLPPLSGFWAKLALVQAGLQAGQVAIVVTALAVSLLTLFSMVKIWDAAFWKNAPGGVEKAEGSTWRAMAALVGVLAAVTLVISFAAEPAMALALQAAGQLSDPSAYIAAVLEVGR